MRPTFSVSSRARLLPKPHRPAAAALHLPHEEDPDADQQQHREPRDQHAEQRRHVLLDRRRGDPHALVDQAADQTRIGRRVGAERATIGEMPGNVVALDRDIRDLPAIDLGNEIRKRERRLRAAGRGCLKQIEKGDEKQPYDDPEGEILAEIVHAKGLSLRLRHRVRCASAGSAAPATDRMLHSLNNCKARRCQRLDGPQ